MVTSAEASTVGALWTEKLPSILRKLLDSTPHLNHYTFFRASKASSTQNDQVHRTRKRLGVACIVCVQLWQSCKGHLDQCAGALRLAYLTNMPPC